jgi:hypothetical protein
MSNEPADGIDPQADVLAKVVEALEARVTAIDEDFRKHSAHHFSSSLMSETRGRTDAFKAAIAIVQSMKEGK